MRERIGNANTNKLNMDLFSAKGITRAKIPDIPTLPPEIIVTKK